MIELFRIGFVTFTLFDLVDVLVVAFFIYRLYKSFKKSVAFQGILVLLVVFVLWRIVELLNMNLLKTILEELLQLGSITVVVLFAPELRRMLMNIAQNPLLQKFRKQLSDNIFDKPDFEEIIGAVEAMSRSKTGALIVLIGASDLKHIIETGDLINASVSKRLLMSIFNKESPLHDGAVMVKNNQIVAARCVLPVSDDPDIPPELGLRHRSALGITEVTDSAAIVVSEQTGKVTVAENGRLKRNLSGEELMIFLNNFYNIDSYN